MELNIRTTQPIDTEYEFQTRLEILDLDKERERGIVYGRDFFIRDSQAIKKDIKMHLKIVIDVNVVILEGHYITAKNVLHVMRKLNM